MTDSREKNEIIGRDTEKDQTAERQSEPGSEGNTRRYLRFKLQTEVMVYSKSGVVPGLSLEIGESGIAAILPVALKIGETVELRIKLPITVAIARAVVRNRSTFRHGFEFLQPMRDVLGHEAAEDACQICGGTGFIVQTVNGEQGVAFLRTKCSDCSGTGRARE